MNVFNPPVGIQAPVAPYLAPQYGAVGVTINGAFYQASSVKATTTLEGGITAEIEVMSFGGQVLPGNPVVLAYEHHLVVVEIGWHNGNGTTTVALKCVDQRTYYERMQVLAVKYGVPKFKSVEEADAWLEERARG